MPVYITQSGRVLQHPDQEVWEKEWDLELESKVAETEEGE